MFKINLFQITFNNECVICFCDRVVICSPKYTVTKAAPCNLSDLKLCFQKFQFYNSMTCNGENGSLAIDTVSTGGLV